MPFMTRTITTLVIAAGAVAGAASASGASPATPSCTAQEIALFAPGERGAVLSGAAHAFQPFGEHVATTARSPKDACPFANEE